MSLIMVTYTAVVVYACLYVWATKGVFIATEMKQTEMNLKES